MACEISSWFVFYFKKITSLRCCQESKKGIVRNAAKQQCNSLAQVWVLREQHNFNHLCTALRSNSFTPLATE
jgi:hypothetical protein